MLFQNRSLTRAAPIQSHDRKGVVSATNAQHHAVEDPAEGVASAKLVFDDPNCLTFVKRVEDGEERWHAIGRPARKEAICRISLRRNAKISSP